MDFFDLPHRTKVDKMIPKSAFDSYITSKQKKLFIDLIQRITWSHKLSLETVNLAGREIDEIQIFTIKLKQKAQPLQILEIITKSIPYHIIFWVEFENFAYISTSSKHTHPTNDNISVLDWTFETNWFEINSCQIKITLKDSLDTVFKDICNQITGNTYKSDVSIEEMILHQHEMSSLSAQIKKIKSQIKKSKQFNQKIDLNIKLKELEKKLDELV